MLIQVGHFSSIAFAFISLLIRVSGRSGGEKEWPQVLLPKRKFVYNACWLELYPILGVYNSCCGIMSPRYPPTTVVGSKFIVLLVPRVHSPGQMGCTNTCRLHPPIFEGIMSINSSFHCLDFPISFFTSVGYLANPHVLAQQPEVVKKVQVDDTQLLWDSIFPPQKASGSRWQMCFFLYNNAQQR